MTSIKRIEHVYIHIPFCLKKCGYCDFYSRVYDPSLLEEYVELLIREHHLYDSIYTIKPGTVYLGGGTPSLLNRDQLKKLLSLFEFSPQNEVTLEANPHNLSRKYVSGLLGMGINRISLGVQSMTDAELKLLGRIHNSLQVKRAVSLLKEKGFGNLSLDLIYGLPDQTVARVEENLRKMLRLQPQHLSIYCLTLSDNVPLSALGDRLPSDEIISEMYHGIREILIGEGFEHYELSSFCLPGNRSKHNMAYWNVEPYLGLGASAAGYLSGNRYTNKADLAGYRDDVWGAKILVNAEEISLTDQEKEYIFLNLRKTEGMDLDSYRTQFNLDFEKKYQPLLNHLTARGMLELKGRRLRLKPAAYFVSDEIFKEFFFRLEKPGESG